MQKNFGSLRQECCEWTNDPFARFRSGNQDVKDASRPGRRITEKFGELLQLVEQGRHTSCQKIAEVININHMTVWNYLKKANYKKKLDVLCATWIKAKKFEWPNYRIITGDEKWVTYENIKRKRSWSKADNPPQTITKPELTKIKVLLSVWWDWKGIVHYEFWCIHRIARILHCRTIICFALCKTRLMVKIGRPRRCWNSLGQVFQQKTTEVLHRWNYEANWKMAKGHR